MLLQTFVNEWLKFFFLLTPFFVLSVFLSMTSGLEAKEKTHIALRVILASVIASLVLFLCGNWLFEALGITVNAFRIGGGALLFLSAVGLVNGKASDTVVDNSGASDIAVVPLAIPVTVGPGTTAALLVMGADAADFETRVVSCLALLLALGCLSVILLSAPKLETLLGRRGLSVLSKLTGLVLAALAAQIMFTGIKEFK